MHASPRMILLFIVATSLTGVCGWVMVEHLLEARVRAAEEAASDPAAIFVPHYATLRPHLRPEYGVVGFVSTGDDGEARGRYQIAAYTLAPIVLARGDEPQLVIADFATTADVVAYANAHGMRIVAGPKPGLALLHRTGYGLP